MTLLLVGCLYIVMNLQAWQILHIVTALRVCEIQMGLFSVPQSVTPRCCSGSIEVAFSTEITMRDISARISSCSSLRSKQS